MRTEKLQLIDEAMNAIKEQILTDLADSVTTEDQFSKDLELSTISLALDDK